MKLSAFSMLNLLFQDPIQHVLDNIMSKYYTDCTSKATYVTKIP